jgi:hypothetical protein
MQPAAFSHPAFLVLLGALHRVQSSTRTAFSGNLALHATDGELIEF